MQAKYIKKIYISLMSIVLLMLTAVTTTFAWVGFLDTSFFEQFEIGLEAVENVEEYGIQLSLSGKEGTFSTSLPAIDIKREILKNVGFANVDQMTDKQVENASFSMDQCTVERSGNSLGNFVDIHGSRTRNYISFDLYVSTYRNADVELEEESTYYMDLFLNDNVFAGNNQTRKLFKNFTYPTNNGVIEFPKIYGNHYLNGLYEMNHPSFTSGNLVKNPTVSGDITVNSASACRLAIEVREAVDLYDTSAYSLVYNTIIYQGGTQYPTYNDRTGEYSFGGILPDDYNIALHDYNSKIMEGYTSKTVPEWALHRGDLEFVNDGITNRLVDSSDSKVGIDQMVKLTFHFWFEGWDADCFSVIHFNPVSLNLSFSNYHN